MHGPLPMGATALIHSQSMSPSSYLVSGTTTSVGQVQARNPD